jgi:hypothetical protein
VTPNPPAPGRRELVVVAAVATTSLLAFAWPWVRELGHAIPDAALAGEAGWGADARLIIWILAWDVHALATHPTRLFDANIFHPEPGMLARSEHLLGILPLSGPVYLASANPVLAANVATLVTYVLAAVVGYAMLRVLGLSRLAAGVAASGFALGFHRVPIDLHVLQYPNYLLALVLLAAVRWAQRPSGGRRLTLAAATLLVGFTSYYVAAMAALLLAVEAAITARTSGGRAALRLAATTLPAFAVLAVFSLPYARAGRGVPPALPLTIPEIAAVFHQLQPGTLRDAWVQLGGFPLLGLAAIGLAAPIVSRSRPTTRWWRWVALAIVGAVLGAGPVLWIGSTYIPLPFAFLWNTPARALRASLRFFVLAQVGLVGLAAEGTALLEDRAARLGGGTATTVLAGLLLAAVVLPRGLELAAAPRSSLPTGAAVPQVYRWLATRGDEPLLEIPGPGMIPANMLRQADSMYLSTYHWLPLVNGHTGFPPWWLAGIMEDLDRLPDPKAVQTIVDLTGVRWIFVRRDRVLPQAWPAWVDLPSQLPDVVRDPHGDPDLLLHVTLAPRRPWAAAIARGRSEPGHTLLGTSLAPLPAVTGRLRTSDDVLHAAAGKRLAVRLTVENDGPTDWPGLAPAWLPPDHLVVVTSTWRRAEDGAASPGDVTRLPHDIVAGDEATFVATLTAPAQPGRWVADLVLAQSGVGPLGGVPAARLTVEVAP